jgi:hypothetical protein
MDRLQLFTLLKYAAVLVAAIIIGNWFLSEVRKAKLKQAPWYTPYLSIPGIIIVAALSLPFWIWLFSE